MKKSSSSYLEKISRVFDIDQIIQEKKGTKKIKQYYHDTIFSYLFLYSLKGFKHMGISRNGKFNKDDVFEQLKIINAYIEQTNAIKVLELGSGAGSNSAYLAKKNKEVEFYGLDLSTQPFLLHRTISNFHSSLGNFHKLNMFPDESFDVVFVIEALCYSRQKEVVLHEVYKKLKKGGVFIIFDGYGLKDINLLNSDDLKLKKLTEKTMALEEFENIHDFQKKIQKSSFKIIKEEDLSNNILPTMYNVQKKALLYFKFPFLARGLNRILPQDLVLNSVAGLLMPVTTKQNTFCYYLHVLKK